MKINFYSKRKIFTIILLIFVLTAASSIENAAPVFAVDGKNVTQNWAAAAVFYGTQADETETYHMTEEEFLKCKTDLETRLIYAYSSYYNNLGAEEQKALKQAQKAWIDCYYSYTDALEQRWLNPVKIFFGETGKERRTNVYREFILLMLTNRITDLEEWNRNEFVRMEDSFLSAKIIELEEAKKELQVDMGLCLYVIQEEYRLKIKEAHRKYFEFLQYNTNFVSLISNENEIIITGEELLQVQRMSYLTSVHYQGCRYFRREREE